MFGLCSQHRVYERTKLLALTLCNIVLKSGLLVLYPINFFDYALSDSLTMSGIDNWVIEISCHHISNLVLTKSILIALPLEDYFQHIIPLFSAFKKDHDLFFCSFAQSYWKPKLLRWLLNHFLFFLLFIYCSASEEF